MGNENGKNASAQTLAPLAPLAPKVEVHGLPTAGILGLVQTIPIGYTAVKEIGKDEMKNMMKRAGLEVDYLNKSENPARTLTLSAELKRFVCACLIKFPSRKGSFVIGSEAPVIVSAENIEAEYLTFAKAFEACAKKLPICKLRTINYIRQDGSTFRRAKVGLSEDAPFFAKEIKEV